jgi:hypothetical protein
VTRRFQKTSPFTIANDVTRIVEDLDKPAQSAWCREDVLLYDLGTVGEQGSEEL